MMTRAMMGHDTRLYLQASFASQHDTAVTADDLTDLLGEVWLADIHETLQENMKR